MSSRRAAALMVASLSLCYAYFYQAGGWNQNSRFDLSRALVESGTARIDAYHQNTGDKARVGEHFYSDKAPGQSLAAVPVLATAQLAGPASAANVGARSWAATVFASGLPAALGGVAVLAAALLLGASRGAALWAALVLALGSPMWAYATLFMGHALAAACLAGALRAALAIRERAGNPNALAASVGAFAGWAVVTEYTAAPVAVAMAVAAGLWLRRAAGQWRAAARPLAGLAAAAAACAVVLGAYHAVAFGSVLETPLRHLYLFPHVREQPFGAPSAAALYEITLGARRGLLPLAPAFALTPLGVVLGARDRRRRPVALGCAAVVAYYLVLNASFATPLAGWSYGPRYLAAALPFAALPLAFVWDAASRRWQRALLVAAFAWGAVLSLIAVATTAQPPEIYASPVTELLWPAFADGDLALNHQSFLEAGAHAAELRGPRHGRDAWNLGQLVGLRGLWSLLPLAAFVALASIAGRRWLRE